MFTQPPHKRAESLSRITRNHKLYFAIFYQSNQILLKAIYELEPATVLAEAERQLDRSKNTISHVGLSINWAVQNGKLVYDHKKGNPPSTS